MLTFTGFSNTGLMSGFSVGKGGKTINDKMKKFTPTIVEGSYIVILQYFLYILLYTYVTFKVTLYVLTKPSSG